MRSPSMSCIPPRTARRRSKRVVAALRQLRGRYPNKLILVSAVWKLAFSGHKRRNGTLYDEQLKAVNECADLLFLESYHSEVNPQLYLFDEMAKNVNARVPGLLKKTIFGLGIPQNRPFPYGDCSPYVEFADFLDAQLHRIKNSPLTRDMPGIGYWVFYRARPETVIHATNLTDHYYVKGGSDFYGDGDYSNRVANPSFEEAGGWEKDPTTSIVPYTDVADLPRLPRRQIRHARKTSGQDGSRAEARPFDSGRRRRTEYGLPPVRVGGRRRRQNALQCRVARGGRPGARAFWGEHGSWPYRAGGFRRESDGKGSHSLSPPRPTHGG